MKQTRIRKIALISKYFYRENQNVCLWFSFGQWKGENLGYKNLHNISVLLSIIFFERKKITTLLNAKCTYNAIVIRFQ